MTAILFGSISTLADTSELQREAFNGAFAQHGLDWTWSRDDYVSMLESNGGSDRVAEYARSRGEDVDAAAVHATKSELFQKSLAESDVAPRDGVADAIREAKGAGLKVALVTTTSAENVAALAAALAGHVAFADLDLVVDSSQVSAVKPDAAAYTYALEHLHEQAGDCVAIEDNVGGVAAAVAAGITTVAFPNANTSAHDFEAADVRRERIDLADLEALIAR